MEPPGGRDSRFNLGYSMNLLSGETPPEIYGSTLGGRPSTSLQLSPRHTMVSSACGGSRNLKSDCYDDRGMQSQQSMGLEACGVNEMNDESPYSSMQSKKSPPSNGKKTKGRVKIKMEYIENKLRRYTTFSKRKTGIMKKAFELSTLTGTQVMLMVASETGHVYTFATRKLQPMITSEAGKALIQTCLNSPDPPAGSSGSDQRMSATGFEETELTYNVSDEDSKGFEDCEVSTSEDNEEEEEELPEYVDVQVLENLTKNGASSNKSTNPPSDSLSSSFKTQPQKQANSDKNAHHVPKKIAKIEKSKDSSEPTIIKQLKKINESVALSNALKQSSQPVKSPKPSQPCRPKSSSPSVRTTQSSSPSLQPPLVIQASPNLQSLILPQPLNIQVHETTPSLSNNVVLPQQNNQPVLQLSENTQISSQIPNGATIVPLLIQTPNGLGFASVSDGMILGRVQNSTDNKLVVIPLSSVTGGVKTEKVEKT